MVLLPILTLNSGFIPVISQMHPKDCQDTMVSSGKLALLHELDIVVPAYTEGGHCRCRAPTSARSLARTSL